MPPAPMSTSTRLGSHPPKGRALKQSGSLGRSINTDASAYPRTNPIGALNTLVKLLSLLPKRIGGCQMKFTPAEHALSLHLISVLDPYVYQGAKSLSTVASAQAKPTISGLIYQPTEILDSIMSYLDSKRDLLNVALCCKHLQDVVIPRHFEYRFIRCKVSSISVWNHLLVNHSLARNVRRLEIVDERSSSSSTVMPRATSEMVVPRGITQRNTDLESTDDELGMHRKQEKYLASALQRMTGLKEFKWLCNHSPISIEHIWPALLMRSGTLDTLEIADNLVFAPQEAKVDSDSTDISDVEGGSVRTAAVTPMATVSNAVFKSTRHNYGACKKPDLSRITDILARCPDLKNLHVSFIRPRSHTGLLPSVNELFEGRWANLTGLTLTGLHSTTPSGMADFLVEHPQLETLHLDVAGIHSLELPSGCLPRLREIHANKEALNGILESGLGAGENDVSHSLQLRPLEIVKGFKLAGVHANVEGKHVDHGLFHNLKKHAKTLSRIELAGWHDMDDIRKLAASAPGLTHLDIGKRFNVNANRGGAIGPVTNLEEWLEILGTLPELRTLHGVKLFYEISNINIPAASNSTGHSTSNSTSGMIHGAANSVALSFGDASVAAKIQSQMSLMDRSRMKKNDWTASMLSWRCPKLRRVDYWEAGVSKIITLTRGPTLAPVAEQNADAAADTAPRENTKVRWEVRRLKAQQ